MVDETLDGVRNLIAIGEIKTIDPSGENINVASEADEEEEGGDEEVDEEVPLLQPYGFDSVPPVGSRGLVLGVGGNEEERVMINASSRTRPTDSKESEVSIYTDNGQRIHLKDDESLIISTKKTTITLAADGSMTIAADDAVTIDAKGDVKVQSTGDITFAQGPGKNINLGEGASQSVAIAEQVIAAIDVTLNGGVPIAMDGGVGLKGSMLGAWAGAKELIKSQFSKTN